MKGLRRRLDKLEGRTGSHLICMSVPKGSDQTQAPRVGKDLAIAEGYRGEFNIFPFDHLGDSQPRIVGEGLEVLISLLNDLAEDGRRRRISRQTERASRSG